MIKLEALSLQRGDKILLDHVDAVIHPGQHVALIGSNGCGKSSLFALLRGELTVDGGEMHRPSSWRISHMAQEVAVSNRSAIDYVIDGDVTFRQVQSKIDEAEQNERHEDLAELYQRLDDIDGFTVNHRAEQLLLGLGFSVGDLQKGANSFSGGWRIRLNLAQALMCPSDLLLLDEPTNHLDIEATLWLEQWLRRYPGTLLLISHDRDFIDAVSDIIIHIDRCKLFTYKGNYSAFERQRAERLSQQQQQFVKQQEQIQHFESFIRRFKAKASKARQAQSRIKALERMTLIAPAHVDSPFDFHFPEPERFSDPLLNLTGAVLGYNGKTIIEPVNLSVHPGSRIGLLGPNGAGKSTLLKSLVGDLPLLNGDRVEGEHLKLGYFSQHQLEALDLDASPMLHLQRLSPTAREQTIRGFLGGFNFHGDMALAPIRPFSGGEKARLALAIIVWQRPNLLLLDEPTNHLDLEMCHALTVAIQEFNGSVIIVSHDRHLLKNSVDEFLLVNHGSVESFDGDLEDYGRRLNDIKNKPAANTSKSSNTPVMTASTPVANAPATITPKSAVDKKAQRQDAAAAREKIAPLNKQLKGLENKIEKLNGLLTQLETQLADSALYTDDAAEKLQGLLQEQGQLRQQKDGFEEQWLEVQEELDTLQ